ncbi:MAG: hypothetical protein WA632_12015 [Gallionella sp.]
MEVVLELFEKLTTAAFVPWCLIADTQTNLFRFMGLLFIVLHVRRIGILLEIAVDRTGREQDKAPTPGWYALSRIGRYVVWISA